MGIEFFEKERIFKLDTPKSSYIIGVVDEENFVGHVYYGKKCRDYKLGYLMRTDEAPFVPSKNERDRLSFLDAFPFEYSTHGLGDFRESCIQVKTSKGQSAVSLSYVEHKIYAGKPALSGLPATFGTEQECSTLELVCRDNVLDLKVILYYSVFEDTDVVTRSVKVVNEGKETIYLTKVLSACLDMDNQDFELLTMHGSWARERKVQYRKIGYGQQGVTSLRGESSHQDHPFMALKAGDATQEMGDVYGMHFVYSGNFLAQAELNQFDSVRAVMGINPKDFCWKLEPQDEFQAPEVVLVYSAQGLDGMTTSLHTLYRKHLIRSEYKDKKRPILINNWEATYFDFNTEKLLQIAKQASELGIEMLVMDDGWFGKRNDDNTSLGDWDVNEEKINGGLKYLVDEVNKLGMKFGIWFEPEMISPDSELYKAHPDWAIAVPDRTPGRARNQFVLDLSRKDVREHTYESIAKILRSANIEYVKWDMNRPLSDIGSAELPADRQGELFHRYVLGVYELQERMMTEFPHLLLENCSGGGARFDPGMLYYSPQIWCSDDTDAIERLSIQEGTAMIYPLSTMGAHVSDCPNHTVGRITPFETRGYVALAGTFGYELDVTKIPEEDRNSIPEQIQMYHKYNDLVREGNYYRIASYAQNHEYDCYMVVSQEQTEALVTFVQVLNRPNCKSRKIKLKGLKSEANYVLEETGALYAGDTLMNAGILIENPWGDFKGKLLHLTMQK
ncbi:MAG: alpha-galactosidase [Lachnospiraceae bacterium]|nr:alpha-galactosidase [Lachnospiraceae bacterium]